MYKKCQSVFPRETQIFQRYVILVNAANKPQSSRLSTLELTPKGFEAPEAFYGPPEPACWRVLQNQCVGGTSSTSVFEGPPVPVCWRDLQYQCV